MLGIIHLVGAQKFSEKRYFGSITTHTYRKPTISYPLIRTCTSAYQGVRNFPKDLV